MSIHNKINVAVIGATGYTGLDLILMLSKHPKVNLINLCATKNLGKKVSYFDKRIKKKLPKITSIKKVNWSSLDLVFLSLPNGEAQKLVKQIYFKYKNLRFIDLSADFRISNPKIFEKTVPHGFRSSFRDWAEENHNFSRRAVELCLAHSNKNKVEKAYLRSDLFTKRRNIMNEWNKFLKGSD